MAAAFQLSLSSSFLPSPLPTTAKTTTAQPLRRFLVLCSAATSSTSNLPKKKHWKAGEFPALIETSTSQQSRRRTPIKNIKKKLDKKNNAKAWVSTVTEALSDAIEKKQWSRALQVPFFSFLNFCEKETTFRQPTSLILILRRFRCLGC